MELPQGLKQLQKVFIGILVTSGFLYFSFLMYREATREHKSPEYFTGFLAYQDRLECGLLRAFNGDRFGCRLSGSICTSLRDHHDQRIRLSGFRVPCGPEADIFCSEKLDFNENGFEPEICFKDWQFVARLSDFFGAPKK